MFLYSQIHYKVKETFQAISLKQGELSWVSGFDNMMICRLISGHERRKRKVMEIESERRKIQDKQKG